MSQNSQNSCCVPRCVVVRKDGVPLHRFPNPKISGDKFTSWILNIGGQIAILDRQDIYDNRRVCHRHFEDIHKYPSGRLSKLAIPTMHIPDLQAQSLGEAMVVSSDTTQRSQLQKSGFDTSGVTIHRFPNPEKFPERFRMWVDLASDSLKGISDEQIFYSKSVCEKHFIEKHKNRNNRLNALALPVKHISRPPTTSTLETSIQSMNLQSDLASASLQIAGTKRHQPDSDDPSGKVLLDYNYGKLPTEHEPPSANIIGTVPQNNPEQNKICVRTQGENTKSHGNKNNLLPPVSEHSDTELPDCDYNVVGEDDSVPLGEDGCAESQIYVKTQSYDLTSAYEKDPLSLKPEPDNDDPLGEDQLCDNNGATLRLLQTNTVISQKVQNNNVSTHPSMEVPLPTSKPSVQDELNAENTNILNLVQQNRIKDDIIKELRISLAQKESKIQTLQHQVKAMELHISIIAPKLKTCEKSKQNFESKEYKRLQKRNLLLKSKLTNKAIFDKLTKDFNTTARTFFEMQCLQNHKKDRRRRFTLQGKILGLSLYKASPTVYKLLSKYFILPSVNSLTQFILQLKRQTTNRNCTVPANDSELNSEHCRAEPDNSEDSHNNETNNTNNSKAFQAEISIFIERLTPRNNEPQTMKIIGPTTLQLHDGLTVPIDEGQTIELVEGIAVELGNGRLIMLSEGQLVECGDKEMPDDDYDGQMEGDDWQNNQDDNLTRNNSASVRSAEKRKESEINLRSTFEDSEELIETHIIKKLKESHPPVKTRAQGMPDLT